MVILLKSKYSGQMGGGSRDFGITGSSMERGNFLTSMEIVSRAYGRMVLK
jgi:hypothetical protein